MIQATEASEGRAREKGMSLEEHRSAEPLSAREIVTTRVFTAPRERVFRAWTDPEHLVRWWGPRGFTSSIVGKLEVRPNGSYRIHMRSPEGSDHWTQGVY